MASVLLLVFCLGGLCFLGVLQLADVAHSMIERRARIQAARQRLSRLA